MLMKFLNKFWSALVSIILLKERGFLVELQRGYDGPFFNKVPFLFASYSSGRSHSLSHCDFCAPAFVTAEKLEWKEGYWDKVNDRNGYPFFLSFFTRARGKKVVKDPNNVTSSCGFIASKILLSKCRTMESWKEATHTFVIKTNSL